MISITRPLGAEKGTSRRVVDARRWVVGLLILTAERQDHAQVERATVISIFVVVCRAWVPRRCIPELGRLCWG